MLVLMACGVRQNLYVFSLYRNPDLDHWIFDWLPTSMVALLAEDVPASFLFPDMNDHQEWLLYTTTSSHGVAAISQLCLLMTSRMLTRPMHVVEHLTS